MFSPETWYELAAIATVGGMIVWLATLAGFVLGGLLMYQARQPKPSYLVVANVPHGRRVIDVLKPYLDAGWDVKFQVQSQRVGLRDFYMAGVPA